MLPEDKNKKPTAEPVTPESDVPPHSSHTQYVLPSAPKGKPRTGPLIRGKIQRVETDLDNPVTNGSKIPLLKSKFMETDERINRIPRKIQRTAISTSDYSKPERGLENIPHRNITNQTTVENVRVSKGIRMKRVVQESSSVKSKSNLISSGQRSLLATSSNGTGEEKSQSKTRPGSECRRKMTKTEVECFTEVKPFTFTGHFRSHGKKLSKKDVSEGSKINAAAVTKVDNDEPVQQSDVAVVPGPTTSYKTVDDFLKMPETSLPDKPNTRNNKKTKIYKSKFWEGLEMGTSKKTSKCAAAKQHKKPYDPEDVKGFIQKQKEMRRIQQIKESKEKQEEYEKRNRMLKELDSKCQRIASKAKHRSETNTNLNHWIDEPKKSKVEIESPSMKYLKPLLTPRKHGSFLKKTDSVKSETAKQAQYLLAEFENIVKRECISFLQKIPAVDHSRIDNLIEKTDKAVGTSLIGDSGQKDTKFDSGVNENDVSKQQSYRASDAIEKAAAKIQAFYRGYKVRQCLREAKISALSNEKRKQFENERHSLLRTQRRWSFPRMPEKPYDNIISKLLPMSPMPMVATSDPAVPGYIPPPPITSLTPRSPSRPKVLPTFPLTPVRLRVYDEPYPKQINQPSNVLRTDAFGSGSTEQIFRSSQLTTMNNSLKEPSSLPTSHRKIHSTDADPYRYNKAPPVTKPNLDLVVPTPLPSIVDVLREKVRMFVDDNKNFTCVENKLEKLKVDSAIYETDFESDVKSSIKIQPQENTTTTRTEYASVINEQKNVHLAADKGDPICKEKKLKKRRSRSKTSTKDGSTTTVDTDVELVSSTSRSSISSSKRQRNSPAAGDTQKGGKSDESPSSSTVTESGFGNFLGPALRLRYEAERERLQIIEKALHIKLQNKTTEGNPNASKSTLDQPQIINDEQTKKTSHESDRLQLAIANCQKESMKAAAEMTKWLSEFRKTVDHDKVQAQRTPLDIATMVYTAVEQARQIGEEKRREKVLKKTSDQHIQGHVESASSSECVGKADKSVETSLILLESYQKDVQRRADTLPIAKHTMFKDYQQQYPSGSERNSPVPRGGMLHAFETLESKPLCKYDSLGSNDCSHSQIENTLEYPSIIPSGNTIDFTSLDPKVSSMEAEDATYNGLSQKDAVFVLDSPDLQKSEDIDKTYENFPQSNSGDFEIDTSDDLEKSQSFVSIHKDTPTLKSSSLGSQPADEIINSQKELKEHVSSISNYNESEEDDDISRASLLDEVTERSVSVEPELLDDYDGISILEDLHEFTEKLTDHGSNQEESTTSVQDEASSDKSTTVEPEQHGDVLSRPEEFGDIKKDNENSSIHDESSYKESKSATPTATKLQRAPEKPLSSHRESINTESNVSDEIIEDNIYYSDRYEHNSENVNSSEKVRKTEEQSGKNMEKTEDRISLEEPNEDAIEINAHSENFLEEVEIPESISNSQEESRCVAESISQNPILKQHDPDDLACEDKSIKNKLVSVEFALPKITPEWSKTSESGDEEILESCDSKDGDETSELDRTSPDKPESVEERSDVSEINESPSEKAGHKVFESNEDVDVKNSLSLPDNILQPESKCTAIDHVEDEMVSAIHMQIQDIEECIERSNEEDLKLDSIHVDSVSEECEPASKEDISNEFESNISVHSEELTSEPIKKCMPFEESKVNSSENTNVEPEQSTSLSNVLEGSEMVEQKYPNLKLSEDTTLEKSELQVVEEGVSCEVSEEEIEDEAQDGVPNDTILEKTYQTQIETELPLKPVPPYSPSSSLESTSLSSRSLIISLEMNKLESIIQQQTDLIWQAWNGNGSLPCVQTVVNMNNWSTEVHNQPNEGADEAHPEAANDAIQSFDKLLYHLVYEIIKEVLQVENSYTPYIERVRPGPLSLQAQRLRIPRTRENLVSAVMKRVVKIIPKTFFTDSHVSETEKPKLRKWCSRPRELVDEVLLEELVEEDYLWTEWWPEEVIVLNQVNEKIVKTLIGNVLKKRTYVYKH
ncbi:unnamed protein product [Orchesella dallaii]|uniref:Centrosome-associated protein 350 n=1 Tax=Orchesella dallaii TaxID=48710 RepID=A0ABP1QR54_9HEXA